MGWEMIECSPNRESEDNLLKAVKVLRDERVPEEVVVGKSGPRSIIGPRYFPRA